MATSPVFAATPRCAVVQVTTANTARDGSGTPVTIFSAGASGSRIERVRVCGTGTTTAGVIRLFIHDNSNARLIKEILVTAITPSTTVEVYSADVDCSFNGGCIILPVNYSLRATTHNTETFNIHVFGADF
jgi:hypothetical protein